MVLAWVVVILALVAAFLAHLAQRRLNAIGLGHYTGWIAWVRRGFLILAAFGALLGMSNTWMPWSGAIVVMIIAIVIFATLRRYRLGMAGGWVLGAGALIALIIVVAGLASQRQPGSGNPPNAGGPPNPGAPATEVGYPPVPFKREALKPNQPFSVSIPPKHRVDAWPEGIASHWSQENENLVLTVWAEKETQFVYTVYPCTTAHPCEAARPKLSYTSVIEAMEATQPKTSKDVENEDEPKPLPDGLPNEPKADPPQTPAPQEPEPRVEPAQPPDPIPSRPIVPPPPSHIRKAST